jgi:hypothetical protein
LEALSLRSLGRLRAESDPRCYCSLCHRTGCGWLAQVGRTGLECSQTSHMGDKDTFQDRQLRSRLLRQPCGPDGVGSSEQTLRYPRWGVGGMRPSPGTLQCVRRSSRQVTARGFPLLTTLPRPLHGSATQSISMDPPVQVPRLQSQSLNLQLSEKGPAGEPVGGDSQNEHQGAGQG